MIRRFLIMLVILVCFQSCKKCSVCSNLCYKCNIHTVCNTDFRSDSDFVYAIKLYETQYRKCDAISPTLSIEICGTKKQLENRESLYEILQYSCKPK